MSTDAAPLAVTRPATRAASWLVIAAVLSLAYNLRPVAVVGPVLPSIRADLGMSDTAAGVLTALPTLCFAVFGGTAPWLSARLGPHRTALVGVVALVLGGLIRSLIGQTWPFLAVSGLALAGMALGNVMLPSLVRIHFPTRVGLAIASYSLVLAIGVTITSVSLVPLSAAWGGWRNTFAIGSALAAVTLVFWIPLARLDRHRQVATGDPVLPLRKVARTRIGWLFAIFFGAQSAQVYSIYGWLPSIYRAAGLTASQAGGMLGLVTGIGIPLSFLLPAYTARQTRPRLALLFIVACAVGGYLGLLFSPARPAWLWAVLIAVGISSFPMILALFGLRARTISGTVALSGFTQTIGYLLAIMGPLTVGWLRAQTGSFTASVWFLLALVIPLTISGWIVCGGGWVEDQAQGEPPAR